MDLIAIQQFLRTHSIFEAKIRVTYYIRVSSDSEAQLNSLENQEDFFITFIKNNPNWTLVPGYVDEGLSGTTVNKRKGFLRMIEDASLGLFDLIIAKDISRFARDTLASIEYMRKLLRYDVGVLFQNDGINTLEPDSELRLTIMAAIAQEESRKLSSRVRFGHHQAIENGKVLGNSWLYGYTKSHGRLVIDESEAKMVRELYELCASGKHTLRGLAAILFESGYRNRKGGKISYMTVQSIISNPKYKGYYVGNKYHTIDYASKKQKPLPPEEWVVYKDETGNTVPAIVDEVLWEKANKALAARKESMKNRQGIYSAGNLFTGKLFCAHCGAPYYFRGKKASRHRKWICASKIKNGTVTCPSPILYEEHLINLLIRVFSGQDAPVENKYDPKKELNTIQEHIHAIEAEKQSNLTDNVCGHLSDNEFFERNNQLNCKLQKLNVQRDTLVKQTASAKERAHILNKMYAGFKKANGCDGDVNSLKKIISEFIDCILITGNDDNESITLDIRMLSSDTYRYVMKLTDNCKLKTESTELPLDTGHSSSN